MVQLTFSEKRKLPLNEVSLYIDWRARKTEIGYWLDNEFVGKGLATVACKQLIKHAFNDLDLKKVEINVASKNSKSKGIPVRLGFKEEEFFVTMNF